jgi:hypothetical protein
MHLGCVPCHVPCSIMITMAKYNIRNSIIRMSTVPLLHVITVATEECGFFYALKERLVTHGVSLYVLGMGMLWEGWLWRLNLIIDKLASLNPDELVVCVDGYDVLYTGNTTSLLRKYREFDTDVVFSAHQQQFITSQFVNRYFTGMKNAGTMMGTVKGITAVYEQLRDYCVSTDEPDDQKALNQVSLVGVRYEVDYKARIFLVLDTLGVVSDSISMVLHSHTTMTKRDFQLIDGTPVFFETCTPEFVHGTTHRDMSSLVEALDMHPAPYKHRRYVQTDFVALITVFKLTVVGCASLAFYVLM